MKINLPLNFVICSYMYYIYIFFQVFYLHYLFLTDSFLYFLFMFHSYILFILFDSPMNPHKSAKKYNFSPQRRTLVVEILSEQSIKRIHVHELPVHQTEHSGLCASRLDSSVNWSRVQRGSDQWRTLWLWINICISC